jgi:hypothetical protein
MAGEDKEKKQAGLASFVFVGCLIIGLGVGFISVGIVRHKTGKW